MFLHGAINHPADDSADEDGEGGGDAEVCADSEGEGADAQEFDDYDDSDSKQDKGPRQFAAEDSVDDSGHQAALRRCGLLAADALDPLDLNLSGGWVVEVLAVVESCGADGIEEDISFCVADLFFSLIVSVVRGQSDSVAAGEVAVVLNAVGKMVEREGDGMRQALEGLETLVHCVQRSADGEDGDDDADHDGDLLLPWGCADEVAGLEVLRGIAGVGGGDADDSADGDGEGSEGGGGPAFDEEDGGGGH